MDRQEYILSQVSMITEMIENDSANLLRAMAELHDLSVEYMQEEQLKLCNEKYNLDTAAYSIETLRDSVERNLEIINKRV